MATFCFNLVIPGGIIFMETLATLKNIFYELDNA